MEKVLTTGSWTPFPGQEAEFVARWREFAAWASSFEGAGHAVLARDLREEGRYVSFIDWESWEAMRAWKDDAEFKPRMGAVQKHIDRFAPTEIEVVAEFHHGAAAADA